MTWSIVARDPESGWMGVAVASRFFAVGALVPHLRPPRARRQMSLTVQWSMAMWQTGVRIMTRIPPE
jgi:uncharacterized Ntn-hydrolase superfamily protein